MKPKLTDILKGNYILVHEESGKLLKNTKLRAEKMAQWLRALVALLEFFGSIPAPAW